MRVIGLTGSIACGKSTISRYLVSLGWPVVDGDQLSRELTLPGSPVLTEIRNQFGERYINDNGNLNRRALGALIFQNDQARGCLDAIMAPHLERLTKERIREHRSKGAALCFLDMPLLFEKGYDRFCDSVWCVWLPEEIQLHRLMERDHFSRDEAMKRIRSVMSSDEKAARSDHVIDNSGSVQQTLAAADRLLKYEMDPSAAFVASAAPSDAPVFRRAWSPAPIPDEPAPPEVMERPASARHAGSSRKAEWLTPFWLKGSLIAFSVFLVLSVAAFWMMSGYLASQKKIHLEAQAQIGWNYHFSDYEKTYRGIVEQYAAEFNLKPAFVAAVIMAESSFRPEVNSGKSARGLMQLLEGTASDRAANLGIPDFRFDMAYDPSLNIRLGCCHLRYLIRQFGDDLTTVMVAYNVGEGNVKRNWLSDYSISDGGQKIRMEQIPDPDVLDYVTEVSQNYGIYQAQFYSGQTLDRVPDSSDAAVGL